MSMHREGLVVSLKEMGFFDSGSADIRPSSLDAITRLAQVLKQRPENLRRRGAHRQRSDSYASVCDQLGAFDFSGHGDDPTPDYQIRLSPSHLSAAGYAEFHPVASNDTPEGRAQNRRLDVVILAPVEPHGELPGIAKTAAPAVRQNVPKRAPDRSIAASPGFKHCPAWPIVSMELIDPEFTADGFAGTRLRFQASQNGREPALERLTRA